jgi:anti-anti-sigma regulatory factor
VGLALASSDPDMTHIVKLTGTDQLMALYSSAEEAAAAY